MKIADQNAAQNWAQKQLKYPFVLVDEDGNINCSPTQDHMAEIADQKKTAGINFFIVRGELPVTPDNPATDVK